jgi:hypothetical protein
MYTTKMKYIIQQGISQETQYMLGSPLGGLQEKLLKLIIGTTFSKWVTNMLNSNIVEEILNPRNFDKRNNKSLSQLDIFGFIYHLRYGCCNLQGLNDTNETMEN